MSAPTPWQIKGTLSGAPLIKDADGRSIGTLYDESRRVVDAVNDTELLDWMIAHSAYLSHSHDGECCNVWFRYDPQDDGGDSVPVEGYPQKCYNTGREAITAAMRFHRR